VSPTVTVIVVTYNGERFVRPCLQSLRAQTYREFETLVIDNASTDGTADLVAREFPEATLVRLTKNTGFAGGNNEGLRRAQGTILVLLNQDTRVGPEWLERLLAPLILGGPAKVGSTHGPILNEGESYLTSSARFDPSGAKLATLTLAGRNCATALPFDPRLILFGSGAGLAVRKVLAGEALFDEDYFAYGEDVALGWRVRLKGGGVLMVPDAEVHHALPPEGKRSTPEWLYLWERNRLFNLYIHYSTRTRWLLHPVFAADVLALALPRPAEVAPDGSPVARRPAREKGGRQERARRRQLRRAVGRSILTAISANPELRRKHAAMEAERRVGDAAVTAAMTCRVTPFDDGLLGLLNRFSAAWCRAFGIVTVESAPREAP